MQLSGVEAARTRRWSQRCLQSLYSDIKERHKRYKSEGEEGLVGHLRLVWHPPPASPHTTSLFPSSHFTIHVQPREPFVSSSLLISSYSPSIPPCFAQRIILILPYSFRHPQTRLSFSSPSLPPSLPVSCCISPTPPNSAKCSRHKSTFMW